MSKMSFLISTLVASLGFAKGPCAQDVEKFCKDVEKGKGRIMKCLKENEAQLSAECKAQRDKMKQAREEVREACDEDVQALCGDVEPGEGRIMKCIKENKEKLSAGCQAEIKEKKEMRKEYHKNKKKKDGE